MSMIDTVRSLPSGRATRGRVPIFRPMLKGEDLDLIFTEASFGFTEANHDLVTIAATSPTLTDTEGMVNAPISFFFGAAPRTELFNGYIMAVEEKKAGSGSLTLNLLIMGTTKVMQVGSPRFWPQMTIPGAVQRLAYLNGLGFDGHEQDYRWPVLSQTSETDWFKVSSLAERLGWRIYSRYGVVMCYDPLKVFREHGVLETLVSGEYSGDSVDAPERSLLEFEPSEDSEDKLPTTGVQMGYFQGGAVQIQRQAGDYDNYRMITDVPLRNSVESALYASSNDHAPSKWEQQAKARLLGDASLYPGMNVEVVTTNTKYNRDRYNGRWFIRAVQHKMDRQSFQTQVNLARPDSKTPVSTDVYQTFWARAGRPKPTLSLVDDKWISSWSQGAPTSPVSLTPYLPGFPS